MRDLVPLEEVSCAATRLGDALASRALSLLDVPRWEASCLMVGTLPGGVRANAVGLGSLGTIAREMAGSVSGLQRALRLSLAGKWIVPLRLDTRSHCAQRRRSHWQHWAFSRSTTEQATDDGIIRRLSVSVCAGVCACSGEYMRG